MKILRYIPSSLFVLGAAIWDIWAPTIEYKDIIVPEHMAAWCIAYYYEYATSANEYHAGIMLVLWASIVLLIIPILRWKR